MMWRDATVISAPKRWGASGRSCFEVEVQIVQAPSNASSFLPAQSCTALGYEALTGIPTINERIRIDVSSLAHNLGTGGHAMVVSRLEKLPDDEPGLGHLVKARYMPEQIMVAGVDEQDTCHHELLAQPAGVLTLAGMPVVVTDLHSALPAVLAGIYASVKSSVPRPVRVAYVMTDGGALPLAYSRTCAQLTAAGWLVGTVTVGQAWGGDYEAVSIHNGLLAAKHVLQADIAVVIQGPGNLGTDTGWGFSGVACGDVINAVATLGGKPIAGLRVSEADARARHRGVSHHSLTAYGKVALAAADVVVPNFGENPTSLQSQVKAQAEKLCQPRTAGQQHNYVEVDDTGLLDALRDCPVPLRTMGRSLNEDQLAFLVAAAAGRHASRLLNYASQR